MKGETTAPGYVKKYQPSDEVVTVDKIYACKGVLSSCDQDFWLRDVCLSFALFKLLKRRFFRYHAADSNLPKTRALVFRGLLSADRDMERALRVVSTELGFLRDLFYTKYPIIFGRGFPIFSTLLFSGIIGVSLWIAKLAFSYHQNLSLESQLIVNNKHVDLYLTYVVVFIIMMMEICEVCLYVFSDWSRVILICRYVNSQSNHFFAILITLLSFVSGPKFSKPLDDTLGQYSFLKMKNYKRFSFRRHAANLLDRSTCGFSATETGKGFHKDRAIKFPQEVKKVIFVALQATGEQLTNGELSLERNKLTHLSLVCSLRPHMQNGISRMYIIMVWHIATDLCEIHHDIHQSTQEPNKEEDTASNRKAAVSLSRYCAYLALFVPELLLPSRCNAEKYVLEDMVKETRDFFEGANSPAEMLDKMWKAEDGREKIVEKGAELGRKLMSNDVLDGQRWKVLAEFWAELILFLAPSGTASVHAEKLAEGGEFITQLWALLYHAGISEQVPDPYATGDSSFIV